MGFVGTGGGASMFDRIEFRLLLLRKLGGDFIENPERVLPGVSFVADVYPPPAFPLCGAVWGLSASSRRRGMLMMLTIDCLLLIEACFWASFLARDRWISSKILGP